VTNDPENCSDRYFKYSLLTDPEWLRSKGLVRVEEKVFNESVIKTAMMDDRQEELIKQGKCYVCWSDLDVKHINGDYTSNYCKRCHRIYLTQEAEGD
jgi:hypothetical protein